MILILCDEPINANEIIDWIKYYSNCEVYRLSYENEVYFLDYVEMIENEIKIVFSTESGKIIDLNNIQSIFIKQSAFMPANLFQTIKNCNNKSIIENINDNSRSLLTYVTGQLNNVKKIGNLVRQNVNKLAVMKIASNIGLKVPKTLITGKKENLLEFYYECNESIITKAIQNMPFFEADQDVYMGFTSKVPLAFIHSLNHEFGMSCFQELVDKEFELRINYLNGKFYTGAIMSQAEQQTSLDFRRYNYKYPNRIMKYVLPHDISQKLDELMRLLDLNTGCIDIIVDKLGNYFFLEVNPVGQYSWIVDATNIYYNREIALDLIKK